jgi:tRNA (guanine9-N1)-methyltransferase
MSGPRDISPAHAEVATFAAAPSAAAPPAAPPAITAAPEADYSDYERYQQAKRDKKRRKQERRAAEFAAARAAEAALPQEEQDAARARRWQVTRDRITSQKQERALRSDRMLGGPALVVDLWYARSSDAAVCDFMSGREIRSLSQQIMLSYAANSTAAVSGAPFCLHLTSLSPTAPVYERLAKISGFDGWHLKQHADPLEEVFAESRRHLIYLSADATEELTTLNDEDILIVGGLVDRNRHPGASEARAAGLGLRTARLPLTGHALASTRVLTTVHVVQLLLAARAQQAASGAIDWLQVAAEVLPARKAGKRIKTSEELDLDVDGGPSASGETRPTGSEEKEEK